MKAVYCGIMFTKVVQRIPVNAFHRSLKYIQKFLELLAFVVLPGRVTYLCNPQFRWFFAALQNFCRSFNFLIPAPPVRVKDIGKAMYAYSIYHLQNAAITHVLHPVWIYRTHSSEQDFFAPLVRIFGGVRNHGHENVPALVECKIIFAHVVGFVPQFYILQIFIISVYHLTDEIAEHIGIFWWRGGFRNDTYRGRSV